MNRKLTIALPLIALMIFGIIAQATAETGETRAGVHVDDYFVYDISTTWSSTNASRTVPASLVEVNSTRSYNVTISSIQENNVTARNTWRFKNGTDLDSLVTLDVDTGEPLYYIPGRPAFLGFFDANLGVNDKLRPGGNESDTIKETISRDYPSGKRDTNVASISFGVLDPENITGTQTTTFYIDKATGVMVERNDLTEFPDQSGTETWKLRETNIWTASTPVMEFTWVIVAAIAAAIVVAVLVVVVLRQRRGKKRALR